MRSAVLLALAIAGATLAGSIGAGSYAPPPGDGLPRWSPDGSRIAFETFRGSHAIVIATPDGREERRLIEGNFTSWSLSPDWATLAYVNADGTLHFASTVGGPDVQVVPASFATTLAWSRDSTRLAFTGLEGGLYRVNGDGTGLTRLASGIRASWSPDGADIVFQAGTEPHIRVVRADGTNERVLVTRPGLQLEPYWSPDGSRIAFLAQAPGSSRWDFGFVRPDGSGFSTYRGPGVSNPGWFTWAPDGQSLVFVSGPVSGLSRIDVTTGKARRLTSFGWSPAVSPDGTRIAFTGGGECRDRYGIHVAGGDGKGVRRITNSCRILGTAGPDRLRGTPPADVLLGLGGDDRLFANDPGYVGDTLIGGPGNDILRGDFNWDTLSGGPGDDTIFGGASGDTIVGGSGHDRLNGQGGRDRIYARDGQRDVVSCGSAADGAPQRDTAFTDRIDSVAADCEVLNGSPTASLTVTVWPAEHKPGTSLTWTLRCRPAGGTLPHAAAACAGLARLGGDPFAPVPADAACTQIYGGPQLAFVRGVYAGEKVWAKFRRRDGCEIARWDRAEFLFPGG